MKCKRLFNRVFALLIASVSYSAIQAQTVSGTVTDKDGAPIAGVSVVVKNAKTGTSTDAQGKFVVKAAANATLVFSSVGFTSQEVAVGGKTEHNVQLLAAANANVEVVVVGYGTVRKKDLTGSVGSVKAKDFNQGVIASPDQLLQGKVSGLEITANSGQPGAATTIKIRGNNSIRSNNNPLYVVDGVPLDGRTARPSLVFTGVDFGPTPETNPLLYINPNDIAQIDVLKDASATAIYGSRGANGIIVITTKKGTTGATKMEVGTSFGLNAGFMQKYKILTADEFRSFTKKNTLNYDSSSSVDALDEITQSKLTQNYSLAIGGGNDNGAFRVSFLGSSTQGFVKKTSLDKYLGNFAGQYKFLDKRLSIDFKAIAGHTTEQMGLITNSPGAGGNLISFTLNWNPTKAFRRPDGSYYLVSNSIPNPLAVIDGVSDIADVNVFLANISASYKIVNHLDYKFLFAINHGAGTRNSNLDGWIDGLQGVSGSGLAAISHTILTSQTFTHTLNYTNKVSQNLNLDVVAGYEYWKTNFTNSTVSASKFNTNLDQNNRISVLYTDFMQNAKTLNPMVTTADPTVEIQSVFGRVNLNLSDKYYLTGTIRADGSNKFGSNNKYGYFPSVGARWILSNEDFMKDGFFNTFGLRASWGITGNQEFPPGASQEQFNSIAYNDIRQSNVANPNLKWEKTTQVNIGLDYAFAHGKVSGSLDYYHKNTTDLLFQSTAIQPAPASVYFINLPANLINSGVEFAIGAPVISGKTFNLDIGFNIAYNKNLLTNFNQAPIYTATVKGQGVSDAFAQIITNDQPVNEFYLKKFEGFDANGQQIIDTVPDFAGDPNPHYLVGFSVNAKYKKWSLSLNTSGAFDYLIYNNTSNTVTNISNIKNGKNISSAALNSAESVSAGVAASTRYLESGDFLKLRNATLTYSFGNVGTYIKSMSAFFSGTNLFVITNFPGFDPEVNVDLNSKGYPSRNMEYIPYPTARSISFGFNFGL